jgi:DNA-binding MarR family transcriptional regulator
VLIRKLGTLNSLQAALLTFAKIGLSTSYELTSQTGMSVGHTLPALKRLEESGLVSSVPGPRKRIEFVLTPEGEKALRESLIVARSSFWEIDKANTFESLSRAVFLLWLYFGKEDALRCISWATEELGIQARRKQYEADEILYDVNRLQGTNLFGEDPSSRDGLLVGKSYQYLKVSSEATLLKMQADAAEQMAPFLDKLPISMQRLMTVDQSDPQSRPD